MFRKHVVGDSEIEATKSKQIFALAKQVLGLNYVDAEGQTFLSYTIRHGQFILAKELIDEGAEKIPLPDGTTIDELINDTLNKAIMANETREIMSHINYAPYRYSYKLKPHRQRWLDLSAPSSQTA
jgi:hypothetical protein